MVFLKRYRKKDQKSHMTLHLELKFFVETKPMYVRDGTSFSLIIPSVHNLEVSIIAIL